MEKHLHIVCLQVPFPPDYGGVMDLYWKLKYLKEQGVHIHLHCFDDNRGAQPALDNFCQEVFYYKRKKGIVSLSLSTPYIVNSRRSIALEKNIGKDNYPILLEGIHCSYLLRGNQLKNRRVVLRLHNNETEYYKQLAENSAGTQKLYYQFESYLLSKYEPQIIKKANIGLSVSETEAGRFREKALHNVHYLPVFVPWQKVNIKEGQGSYCLYHGNLGVEENENAALWLINNIFAAIDVPLIIAGKNPTGQLRQNVKPYSHIKIEGNPDPEHMQRLIRNAHINILPSFSETGIKFKLLHALFEGRFCIVNNAMISGTPLEKACIVANTASAVYEKIRETMNTPFGNKAIADRAELLSDAYNNESNAIELCSYLFN